MERWVRENIQASVVCSKWWWWWWCKTKLARITWICLMTSTRTKWTKLRRIQLTCALFSSLTTDVLEQTKDQLGSINEQIELDLLLLQLLKEMTNCVGLYCKFLHSLSIHRFYNTVVLTYICCLLTSSRSRNPHCIQHPRTKM